jgi:D-sedoheptulose 7-phosphate isomerase
MVCSFSEEYMREVSTIANLINYKDIEDIALDLMTLEGRLFIIGVGGSLANAGHAVNDFRKIANIETYSPENIYEMTARINDDGFDSVFTEWLRVCTFSSYDALLVLSVGGGDQEKNISVPIIKAIDYANKMSGLTLGIVSRNGGYTAMNVKRYILVPTINKERITPHAEEFQSVILHLLVSHPLLKQRQTKWESTDESIIF